MFNYFFHNFLYSLRISSPNTIITVKRGNYITQLDTKVLAYLNKPQKKHIDDISYNTNIQLEVLQETLNNLVHLSYVEQDHKLDNTPMPPNIVSIFLFLQAFIQLRQKACTH